MHGVVQEAEWLFGIPAADALAHPERVLEQGGSWRGVLVSGAQLGPGCRGWTLGLLECSPCIV